MQSNDAGEYSFTAMHFEIDRFKSMFIQHNELTLVSPSIYHNQVSTVCLGVQEARHPSSNKSELHI